MADRGNSVDGSETSETLSSDVDFIKEWGSSKFWGLGFDFDPTWLYTREEKRMMLQLIELCRVHIRPKAEKVDKDYIFPRSSLEALSRHGFMNLVVPKELNGGGAGNQTAMLACETIARYGDPSVAMVYIMHICALFFLCAAHHNNKTVQELLSRLDNECLVGTVAASDPTTGGHFWYFLSAKSQRLANGFIKLYKSVAWVTSAGHADFYVAGAPDPDRPKNCEGTSEACSHNSFFLLFKDEVRAESEGFRGLGLHGNHSSSAICEAELPPDRLLSGSKAGVGDDYSSVFHCLQSAAFLGIALNAVDIGKAHVQHKLHADTGQQISDYPIIQDYFGHSISQVNICRLSALTLIKQIDKETHFNNWILSQNPEFRPRAKFAHWTLQLKIIVSQVTDEVTTRMVRACGGAGYTQSVGIERLLRDSKAYWVMGPSSEMARKIVGQMVLKGMDSIDLFETHCDYNALLHQANKLAADDKRLVAAKLLAEADRQQKGPREYVAQGHDFDNPFNTSLTAFNDMIYVTEDGVRHEPGLSPMEWISLKLVKKLKLDKENLLVTFALPNPSDHSATLPGQHISARIAGKDHEASEKFRRYYSPISKPDDYGRIELVIRSNSNGVFAQHIDKMHEGDESLEFRGPSGGFEYYPNTLDYLIAVCSGTGVTPAIQLVRTIQEDGEDRCKMYLFYANAKPSQILLRNELTRRAQGNGNFVAKFVVHDGHGVGTKTPILEEGYMDEAFFRKNLPSDLLEHRHKILVCGGPQMIISVLYALRAIGIPSESLFIYGPTAAEYVRAIYGRSSLLSSHRSFETPSSSSCSIGHGLCTAREVVGKDGKAMILTEHAVSTGIRLENWSHEPKLVRDSTGAILVLPNIPEAAVQ